MPYFAFASYYEFRGNKEGWHFHLLKNRTVVGIKGAFSNSENCENARKKLPFGTTGKCYLRQTLEYYRWQKKQMKAWVLPIKSGEKSKHLIMPNLEWCLRVASSRFYYASEKITIPKRRHFKRCITAWITFKEVETRYPFVRKHQNEPLVSMQLFKAWSFAIDHGKYITLLQFPNKQKCEQSAKKGFYEEVIFSNAVNKRLVKRFFVTKKIICEKRPPRVNEIPLILQ